MSFSVGSVICRNICSPTTPLLMRSEKAMAEFLSGKRHSQVCDLQQKLTQADARTRDSLVVPRDLQQVVIVTDKGVEPDALVCAGDLQRRGRVGCSLDSESHARSRTNGAADRAAPYRWSWTPHSSSLWNLEEDVKSDSPAGLGRNWATQSRLPWSFRFNLDVSFPLSSFRTTS